ncbi:glycosyltransferase [Flavihumibacter sp. R14]|nr:glycosyltransferase [Flavihumibacter soli]
MSLNPNVSVIMPVYNCGDYVAEAIQSILNQTFGDFELIIIDDQSTDHTREVVASFDDPRIRLIVKPKNSGYSISLNMGLELARGRFIARMDGDDISAGERFEKQVCFLNQNPQIAVCGTWFKIISTEEKIRYPTSHEAIKVALLDYCVIGHPTVMFRKSFLEANDLRYNTDFEPAEDYELWSRIIALGEVANIPEILLEYRKHENQVSRSGQDTQRKNSELCKTRILCYPIIKPTDSDYSISKLIVSNNSVDSFELLCEIILWLNNLLKLNRRTEFFRHDEFHKIISLKKTIIIRRFYLNTANYTPSLLYNFFRWRDELGTNFTITELAKFSVKCVVFWKYPLPKHG